MITVGFLHFHPKFPTVIIEPRVGKLLLFHHGLVVCPFLLLGGLLMLEGKWFRLAQVNMFTVL